MMEYSVPREDYDKVRLALEEIVQLDPGLWKTAQDIAERGLEPLAKATHHNNMGGVNANSIQVQGHRGHRVVGGY